MCVTASKQSAGSLYIVDFFPFLSSTFLFHAGVPTHSTKIPPLPTSATDPTPALQSGWFQYCSPLHFCVFVQIWFDLDFYFVLKQTRAFMFPPTHPCPSTPQTPKMMQLRFGANSPRPSPFYSPSSNPVQPFRCLTLMLLKRVWSTKCIVC